MKQLEVSSIALKTATIILTMFLDTLRYKTVFTVLIQFSMDQPVYTSKYIGKTLPCIMYHFQLHFHPSSRKLPATTNSMEKLRSKNSATKEIVEPACIPTAPASLKNQCTRFKI
jgi:hypothetical protein